MNYSMSREIEEGALAPRAKYWMTQAQAAGHESKLSTLNTNSDPVQFYNFDPEAPMAIPQQQGGAKINSGLRSISESMRQIIGQSAGMFAANMGDNPGLQSGVAIERLQNKRDNGTIKYFRAREIAITYTGKLLVKAIPKVYDTPRQIRLMYEDGTFEMTALNEQQVDQQTGKVVTLNDLSQGIYDVVCKAGPSFRNRQEETIDVLLKMSEADPSILQLGGDLLLQAVSTPVSEQLAERKRAMMMQQGLIPENQWTDEEKQMMAQKAQQSQQNQDPNMVLAMAEQMKAQAEMLNAQNKQQELQMKMMAVQLKGQESQISGSVDVYNAETNRFKAETEAQAKGAKITVDTVDAQGKQLDNLRKSQELAIPPMLRQPSAQTRMPGNN
jgi:DNA-binding protein